MHEIAMHTSALIDAYLLSVMHAVPVQRLRHQVQEGGAARGGDGDGGHGPGRVRLLRAAGAVRRGGGGGSRKCGARALRRLRGAGVPVRRRWRRRGRRGRAAPVPRVAPRRRRAGGAGGRVRRGLAGADDQVPVQLAS